MLKHSIAPPGATETHAWFVTDLLNACLLPSQERDPNCFDNPLQRRGPLFMLAAACTKQEVSSVIWIRDVRCFVARVLAQKKK
jgi:hypothetical protein